MKGREILPLRRRALLLAAFLPPGQRLKLHEIAAVHSRIAEKHARGPKIWDRIGRTAAGHDSAAGPPGQLKLFSPMPGWRASSSPCR